MAVDGTTVLVQVRTSTGPDVFTTIGGQRGMSIDRSGDTIDTSSKDSYDKTNLPGKRSQTLSLDSLYVPNDTAKAALVAAYEASPPTLCKLRKTAVGAEAAKTIDAIVTSLHEEYPDGDAAVFNAEFTLSGAWA
jgi:predicted secreted protein